MACYNVSKAAVISLSETLRSELAPFSIGVSVVCPSFFNTNIQMNMRACSEFQRSFSSACFDNARMPSENIAQCIIKAYENNRLYVIPQASARLQWLLKRISPERYYQNQSSMRTSGHFYSIALALARLGLV